MAIQNFIGGGFYGKLGMLVGQRWRGKYTLRTWVRGTNPRTPKQQAWRGTFKQAVELSQLGNQMNQGSPYWDTSEFPEWSLRMRRATDLIRSTPKILDMIPLFPPSYTPPYQIATVTKGETIGSNTIRFYVTGTLPAESRKLSVMVGYPNAATESYDLELFDPYLIITDTPYFDLSSPTVGRIDAESQFLICSRDDRTGEEGLVYCPQTTCIAETVTWNSLVTSVSSSDNVFQIKFGESAHTVTSSNVTASVHAVSSGVFVDMDFPLTVSSDGTNLIGTFTQTGMTYSSQKLAFSSGSTIKISGTVVYDSKTCSPAVTTVQTVTSDDLERTFDVSSYTVTFTDGAFSLSLPESLIAPASAISASQLVTDSLSGLKTTANPSVTGVGNGTSLSFSVPRPQASYLNRGVLGVNATFALQSGFTVNGVTYLPSDTTAQSISNASDKVTIHFPASMEINLYTAGSWRIVGSDQFGTSVGLLGDLVTALRSLFVNVMGIKGSSYNLTNDVQGSEVSPLISYTDRNESGVFALLFNVDTGHSGEWSVGDSVNFNLSISDWEDLDTSGTVNDVPYEVDISAIQSYDYGTADFNIVLGATVALEEI